MREPELKEIAQRVYDALIKVEGRQRDNLILTFTAHILLTMPADLREIWLQDLEQAALEKSLAAGELEVPGDKVM